MSESKFPPNWDENRVQRLLAEYEGMTEEQQVADDEAAAQEQAGRTVIAVPEDLLPAIRQLLATHKSA